MTILPEITAPKIIHHFNCSAIFIYRRLIGILLTVLSTICFLYIMAFTRNSLLNNYATGMIKSSEKKTSLKHSLRSSRTTQGLSYFIHQAFAGPRWKV
jgi:hypothetical protein